MKVLISTYRPDGLAVSGFRPLYEDVSITARSPWSPQAKIVFTSSEGKEIVVDRADLIKALEALK